METHSWNVIRGVVLDECALASIDPAIELGPRPHCLLVAEMPGLRGHDRVNPDKPLSLRENADRISRVPGSERGRVVVAERLHIGSLGGLELCRAGLPVVSIAGQRGPGADEQAGYGRRYCQHYSVCPCAHAASSRTDRIRAR